MSNDIATAFWIDQPGRGSLHQEPLAPLRPGEVTVRALHSAVSRGTEALVFRGEVPSGEYDRMRAPFQAGQFPGPVKYGYSNVGVVEEGDPALIGRPVFCLYPHQDRYRVARTSVLPIPELVPPARAVLAANLETAINGLWDAEPKLGDHITVVGAGVVGLLVAFLASRIPGTDVEVVDVAASRAAVAEQLGLRFATPDSAREDADLVIHASGSSDGLATALRVAGFEATVLEMSWYGKNAVAAPLGGAFHSRRLVLRSAQVGTVPASQRARWTHRRRLQLALSLLAEPGFDCLISGDTPFAHLPALMARLAIRSTTAPLPLCERINYAPAPAAGYPS